MLRQDYGIQGMDSTCRVQLQKK